MSKLRSDSATLDIDAPDAASEIFVIDAGLDRIASGLGHLELEVPLGIYKIRFRSAATLHDELVEVLEPGARKKIKAPPIRFHTAAPIDDTSTTHEYHSYTAADASRNVDLEVGAGGGLFLFVREEDEEETFEADGVTVHALDGNPIAALEKGTQNLASRWAALNLRMDPGTYRVRVADDRLGSYELFITVSPGWQTQVFLVTQNFYQNYEKVRLPALNSASILMSADGAGFNPDKAVTRLSELARHAITQGRNVISSSLMQKLLSNKFEDPMLGLIGAHLLLRKHRPDRNLLYTVCDNLDGMLGDHPDLKAIEISINDRSRYPIESIDSPPTLRLGWDAIVRGTRRRASLVKSDSLLALIGEEAVGSGPWLMHRVKEEASTRAEKLSIERALNLTEQLLSMDPDLLKQKMDVKRLLNEDLSGLERSLLLAAKSYAYGKEIVAEKEMVNLQQSARKIFSDLSAPSYSITKAVKRLSDKLDIV